MANVKYKCNFTKGAKDKPFVKFDVSQDRWDEIFGKKEEKAKPGRYVWDGEKLVHEDESAAKERPETNSPAIHDDRLYKGVFDFGAGRVFNSRTERKNWMKQNGFECKG